MRNVKYLEVVEIDCTTMERNIKAPDIPILQKRPVTGKTREILKVLAGFVMVIVQRRTYVGFKAGIYLIWEFFHIAKYV